MNVVCRTLESLTAWQPGVRLCSAVLDQVTADTLLQLLPLFVAFFVLPCFLLLFLRPWNTFNVRKGFPVRNSKPADAAPRSPSSSKAGKVNDLDSHYVKCHAGNLVPRP